LDAGAFSYEKFIAGIDTVVMGRGTYDAIAGFGGAWPYAEQRSIVVTSSPIDSPAGQIETWSDGIDALITDLRSTGRGDVWVVGGGQLQQAFIAQGGLNNLTLCIVPELVGGGISLFPPNGVQRTVTLVASAVADNGCAFLKYDFRQEQPIDTR
jgi:dihydrofolate reductase